MPDTVHSPPFTRAPRSPGRPRPRAGPSGTYVAASICSARRGETASGRAHTTPTPVISEDKVPSEAARARTVSAPMPMIAFTGSLRRYIANRRESQP